MNHSFDTQHAAEFGIEEAILIQHFQYWIAKNKANERHNYEGRTWTYCSGTAFENIFWYLKPRSIRTALESLRKQGVIITNNFNENKYDRTIWYAFVDEERFISPICQFRQMDLSISANANVNIDKSNSRKRQIEQPKTSNPINSKDTVVITDTILFSEKKETNEQTENKEIKNPVEATPTKTSPSSAPPPPISEEESRLWDGFMRFCKEEGISSIFKMSSPLTPQELQKLYKDYNLALESNRDIFKQKIIALDNGKKYLKENSSTYKTIRNWLNMHREKYPTTLQSSQHKHNNKSPQYNQLPDIHQ